MAFTITVDGMSCGHCEQTVEEALLAVEAVPEASADQEAEQAMIEGKPDPQTNVQAVSNAGYTART